MIKVDLEIVLSFFLLLVLFLVLGRWIFYNYRNGENGLMDSAPIVQCPYCAYIFRDLGQQRAKITVCPRCKSYISEKGAFSKEEQHREKEKEPMPKKPMQKTKNNESGVVLIIVLVLSVVAFFHYLL